MTPDYQFFDAIQRGCISDADQALASGADINFRDFRGHSALEIAEQYQRNDMIAPLVLRGADPNQQIGKRGDRLLHRAARQGNIGIAEALIQNGATVDAVNHAGKTPLFIAVRCGNEYLAQLLLESGANVNVSEPQTADTPLHLAARNGDKAMIRMLLSHGADASRKNKAGYLPLHEAAAAGQTDAARFLLERCHHAPDERAALLLHIRHAAELHGHYQTAEAIRTFEQSTTASFAGRVRESQAIGQLRER